MKPSVGAPLGAPDTPALPQRKQARLRHYDYASPGMYFVTICTRDREMLFGRIVDGKMILNAYGNIVSDALSSLSSHYETVQIDCSVIMPNHIHMIVWIFQGNGATPALGNIIRGFKSEVSRRCSIKIWQRNYHEHIIRNEQDLQEIRTYIDNNPMKWEMDRHNPNHGKYITWQE